MIHREWKKDEEYRFCESLTAAQWAWEFLRRNPEYQRQWRDFIAVWRELEATYGKPPNRDFCAWKNDPRAWVPVDECEQGDCRVDQDKVLIECAMGARWGFYKFPPDPEDDDPIGEGRLSWRPMEMEPLPQVEEVNQKALNRPEAVALLFDLSLPLKPQMEQARRQLQMEAAARRRQGLLMPRRISTQKGHLTLLLRLLDAEAVAETEEAAHVLGGVDGNLLLRQARQMMEGKYRELLLFPP